MRHETRDSTDLYFTLEVILGGAGQTSFMIGSSPTVSIYSVSLDAYWSDGTGPLATGWVQIPGTLNPPGLGAGLLHDMLDHHHHASGTPPAAANECLLPGLFYFDANNTTGPFAGQDIWTTDPGSGDQGYILCFREPVNNILEYAHIALLTNSTINANVVDWGGVAANISVGGDTDLPAITVAGWSDPDVGSDGLVSGLINIVGGAGTHKAVPNTNVSYYAQVNPLNGGSPAAMASGLDGQPDVNVLGWGNNLLGGVAADIALSPSFKPSVNTVEWDGAGVASSPTTGGMPGVSIQEIKGISAKTGTDTARLQVDVKEWDSDDTAINVTDNFPDVNVMEWEGDTGAVKTSASTGLPEVDVDSINDSSSAANNLQDFMDEGYDNINNAVENVNLIRPDGIQEDSFQADAISSRVFDDDAITADVIADNAIDEGAIQVDSVTYEEISSSAVAEIVEGIWNADVRSPIDDSGTYNGSSYSGADIGSMGHAMLAQYITQHTVHNSADGFTPYHNCAHDDSDGKRFYSSSLASDSLSGEQMPGYIDRTAILARSIFSATPEDYEQYLVRIISVETDGHGQHFVIQMVDEDESSIPGGIVQSTDSLIVKAETDPTMHEVAHEVWEESVFDHETADTFGMFSRIMTGLTQFNHRITDSLYDDSGRLLSCRLVVYPSSEDAKNETNALTTVEVTSTYDEKQNMETFLAKEE